MISIDDGVDQYLKEVAKYPVLTREEEQALFERLKAHDETAREQIVKCNLRFVVKMALRYQGQGVTLADLIQEGNIGLIEVVDRFDHRKGFRFSTYAAFWIKQSIQQALCRQSRLIRLPIRKTRMLGKIGEASRFFAKREGREPNTQELAEMVHATPEQIEQLTRLNEPSVSFDATLDDDGPSLQDVLPQTTVPSPRDKAMEHQLERRVDQAMNQLGERERKILWLRFGFGARKGLSLRNTSARVGLSQEGVRRIEQKTLKRLRTGPMRAMLCGLV